MNKHDKFRVLKKPALFLCILAVIGLLFVQYATSQKSPYYIGADISNLPQRKAQGIVLKENGTQKDLLEIMNTCHFNLIRLRIFHNPVAENGFSKEVYFRLEQTKIWSNQRFNQNIPGYL
jgi:arabinogalactan endo-1,4-beta-galactosidase